MSKKKIVLLATDCDTTHVVYNFLNEHHPIGHVVIEDNISKSTLIKRRIKKLGFFNVMGQLAFIGLVLPFIKRSSSKRKDEITSQHNLRFDRVPDEKIKRVSSVNSDETLKLLDELSPDLVIVNGTRIISSKVLNHVKAPFINIHTGITPKYRGVHGGYWAVAAGDAKLFGTTIHQVDAGIDTGRVLSQVLITPDKKDSFYTYPYLQYAICLPELKRIVDEFVSTGKLEFRNSLTNESRLWYHPTIWEWFSRPGKV